MVLFLAILVEEVMNQRISAFNPWRSIVESDFPDQVQCSGRDVAKNFDCGISLLCSDDPGIL